MVSNNGVTQTAVGIIPNDWNVVSANDVCLKIQDGSHFSPEVGVGDYLYITSKNIKFGYLDLSNIGYINKSQHDAIYQRCDVKKGDLLLTKDGANTGNAALNSIDEEFSLLSSVAFLRFDPNNFCPQYFLQQVLSSQFQHQIQDAMSGNAITRLTLEKIRRLLFPVPPTLNEQQAIAEVLSDMDGYIDSLEQLIAKKRMIKQGVMQELLTGKRRLPGFSREWERKTLGEIAELYQPETISAKLFTDSGFPVYGANGIVGFYSKTNHNSWQVTVTCRGSTCGTVNKTVDNCWITGNAMVLNCDKNESIDKKFFYYLLSIQDLSNCITGTGQPQIVRSPLANYEVIYPIDIGEQISIAKILLDIDKEISELNNKLSKIRLIKEGLMQELLTGRIRLI